MRTHLDQFDPAAGDSVSSFLTAALGTTGLIIGIVGAVIDSAVLAIVAGAIALLLAGLAGWLLNGRRRMQRALADSNAKVSALEGQLAERVQQNVQPQPSQEDRSRQVREAADVAGLTRVSEALSSPESSKDLTDARTGLLGESFFRVTLDARVASARRHLRPLALILLDVIEGATHDNPTHADPVRVAEIAQATLRDADTLCRLDDGRFAMILEDTPENGAIWTVERIRRRINEDLEDTTAWAGVACYPAHGFDGAEVLAQALKAITAARDWRQDRTEVAES